MPLCFILKVGQPPNLRGCPYLFNYFYVRVISIVATYAGVVGSFELTVSVTVFTPAPPETSKVKSTSTGAVAGTVGCTYPATTSPVNVQVVMVRGSSPRLASATLTVGLLATVTEVSVSVPPSARVLLVVPSSMVT